MLGGLQLLGLHLTLQQTANMPSCQAGFPNPDHHPGPRELAHPAGDQSLRSSGDSKGDKTRDPQARPLVALSSWFPTLTLAGLIRCPLNGLVFHYKQPLESTVASGRAERSSGSAEGSGVGAGGRGVGSNEMIDICRHGPVLLHFGCGLHDRGHIENSRRVWQRGTAA